MPKSHDIKRVEKNLENQDCFCLVWSDLDEVIFIL